MQMRNKALPPPDYAFGSFTLHCSRRQVIGAAGPVALGSRAFDLLALLVTERARVVGKQELLTRIWQSTTVEENNLSVAVSALRRALGHTADHPFVRTVSRHGYQFVAEVRTLPPRADNVAAVPSLAVLPFTTDRSKPWPDGAEHDLWGDGIAEGLTAQLSCNRWLQVIAHSSSAALDRTIPPGEVARQLGVRYVLRGSVAHTGTGVRVASQLLDAAADTLLVTVEYDAAQADIFAARDDIARLITAAIRPALMEAEQERGLGQPPDNLDAWAACQRGAWHLARFGRPELLQARTWFERATVLDPGFAPGFHGLALAHLYEGSAWLPGADRHWQTRGESLALQAIVLDDRDSGAYAVLGFARMARGDHAGSLEVLDHAVRLNPNDAMAHAMRGATLVFGGRPRDGLPALEHSFRLSPRDPRLRIRQAHAVLGHFFDGDGAAAEAAARAMMTVWPDYEPGPRLLCYILAEAGQLDDARAMFLRAKALGSPPFSQFTHDRMRWYRLQDFARVAAILRRIGGDDGVEQVSIQ